MKMSNIIKNKHDIVFVYDVTDNNPNGDPNNENKPRIDQETNTNYVTDVRLKRTIRDYAYNHYGYNGTDGKDIFCRQTPGKNGGLSDAKRRSKDFDSNADKIIEQCIDIRWFGGMIPIEKKTTAIQITGPIQFRLGRSVHKVEYNEIKGTGAFTSKEGNSQQTFRTDYILPYSLISFYGMVDNGLAKISQLSEEDYKLFIDIMWDSIKSMCTRSKVGHTPRILIDIEYSGNFFIGELDKYIVYKRKIDDYSIRSIKDFHIDFVNLSNIINENIDKIERVTVKLNDMVQYDNLNINCDKLNIIQ